MIMRMRRHRGAEAIQADRRPPSWGGRRWAILAVGCGIVPFLGGASCCYEPLAVPDCPQADEPLLLLEVDQRGPGEFPLLVAGRACGGTAADAKTVTDDYEVVVYARTDQYYVQPFADDFRLPICGTGFFWTPSHEATRVHAFLARRGLNIWPDKTAALPGVDGMAILAAAELILETP